MRSDEAGFSQRRVTLAALVLSLVSLAAINQTQSGAADKTKAQAVVLARASPSPDPRQPEMYAAIAVVARDAQAMVGAQWRTIAGWKTAADKAVAAKAAAEKAHVAQVTTTHTPQSVIPAAPAVPYTGTASGSVNGYPCGGDLPSCCTLLHESHGTPTAQNPSSTASGLWQFLDTTWAGYGGYAKARYAPPEVQNERARIVFAGGAGASNWFGDGCYNGR